MPPQTRAFAQKQQTVQFPDEGQQWGALNWFDAYARFTIQDVESMDLFNWMPMQTEMRQTPHDSIPLGTLPSTAVWIRAEILNGGIYIFALCTDGHIYQMSASGGTPTNISGATTLSSGADIANWEGQRLIFSDKATNTYYSWNGSTWTAETALTGIPPTCITVFSQRLWIANNNTITFTAGGTYNSLGGDSSSFQIIDEDSTQQVQALEPFNGLLYVFGPNYVQIIGNLVTAGSPAVLTFTKNTIAAEIGTVTRWSIQGYGANIFFACSYGIFTMSGAVPQKLSSPLDGYNGIFDLSQTSWSAGFGSVYQTPVLAWHAKVLGETNPCVFAIIPQIANTFTGITSTTGGWFRHSDGPITFVTSEMVNNVPTLFGTDGTHIFNLMTDTTQEVTSRMRTKYWNMGTSLIYKAFLKYALVLISGGDCNGDISFIDDSLASIADINFSVNNAYIWLDANNQPYEWDGGDTFPYTWLGGPPYYQPVQFNLDMSPSRLLAADITITGTGNALLRHIIQYEMTTADWGD